MAEDTKVQDAQSNGRFIDAAELLQGDFVEYYDLTLPDSIPVFGGRVLAMKTLRSSEVDAWESSMAALGDEKPDRANFRARLVQRAIIDSQTKRPVFKSHKDGIEQLARLPAGFVNYLFDEVCARNKIGRDAIKQAEEDLARNPTDEP